MINLVLVLSLLCMLSNSSDVLDLKMTQFVGEQAHWRKWDYVFCVTTTEKPSWKVRFLKEISNRFTYGTLSDPNIETKSNYGVLILWPNTNITDLMSPSLIITNEENVPDLKYILNLAGNGIDIKSDIIIAYKESCHSSDNCKDNFILEQADIFTNCTLRLTLAKVVYKIDPKSSITTRLLGSWSFGSPPDFVFLPPESRRSSLSVSVSVGVKETLDDNPEQKLHSFTTQVEKKEEKHLLRLLSCIFSAMNISYERVVFPKLGWRNEEGGWTHLLGAIAEGGIHVAAHTVDTSMNYIRNSMALTNPVIKTMNSLYLRQPEGGRLRDVVQVTFSPMLQLSVFVTGLLVWVSMLTITLYRARSDISQERRWEPTEALIWTISVLCMQGSSWSPKSLSGCILVMISLIFALITYNSFAAYVTSVLSTHDNPIRGIADLLKSEFQFGYVQPSSEELFLRTVDDAVLRALYYRGLLAGSEVADVTEGMERTARGSYAFFTTSRLARRALVTQVPLRWQCHIMELSVPMTKTPQAIPLSSSSPYNVLINYWLVRLEETGILARIRSRLLPSMPSCSKGQQFIGASLSDVMTAYFFFVLGVIAAWLMLLLELLWVRRQYLTRLLQRRKQHPEKNRFTRGLESDPTWLREYVN